MLSGQYVEPKLDAVMLQDVSPVNVPGLTSVVAIGS